MTHPNCFAPLAVRSSVRDLFRAAAEGANRVGVLLSNRDSRDSELIPESKLDNPRIPGARHLSKVTSRGHGATSQRDRIEVGMVEYVEQFAAELDAMALLEPELFIECHIEIYQPGTDNRARTRIPEESGCGLRECGRVEPLKDRFWTGCRSGGAVRPGRESLVGNTERRI